MNKCLVSALLACMFWGNKAQESDSDSYCDDYYWEEGDFPDGATQNFAAVDGDRYLNESDFQVGGDFYGQKWEDVFFSGLNRTKSPPESYYRPLGFRYAELGVYNDPTICLHATSGVQGYKVELMVYTITRDASICVEDMNADDYNQQETGAVSACDSQYVYKCFDADTDQDILDVAIYCATNCEDINIQVLWRFRRSSLAWDDTREFTSENPEMWCNMIASDIVWPDAIEEAIPEEYTPNENISSANMIIVSIGSFMACILALLN